ncbi:MAG: class I SAM-dependent methyltransferase [Gaiellaceae bacterium]|jgi:ubiquinone/menaquinone biosynthesis C-methylase UbiE
MTPNEPSGEAKKGAKRNDVVRARFATATEHFAERTREQAPLIAQRAARLLAPLRGDERALDAGTGAGALALALATLVGEVVGCDVVPEMLATARKLGADLPNLRFVEGDIFALPFETASFDIVGTIRTLHHLERPEKALPELVRVTRPNGRLLIIDQLAPLDPLRALEIDRFEQARDPSHTRTLSDQDMRGLFDMNGLTLLRQEIVSEQRDLEQFLDGAGCEGEQRERVRRLAPGQRFTVELGWYVLERRV